VSDIPDPALVFTFPNLFKYHPQNWDYDSLSTDPEIMLCKLDFWNRLPYEPGMGSDSSRFLLFLAFGTGQPK